MNMSQASKKPTLHFWQIWNMCFGFFGIQFGFALQNSNVSRIFQTLGASIDDIPMLWVAAPITGLLVQPIVGYLSDRTWGRLGRRRPYFAIGAILASIALLFMPNSPTLWFAAGMLWIMDASFNIAMEPFRALVGDMLPTRQRSLGFAMQSFFIGAGSVLASSLPWILSHFSGFGGASEPGVIPQTVKMSFYLGAGVLLLSVLWTVLRTKEYSPEQLQKYQSQKENINADFSVSEKVGSIFGAYTWILLAVLAGGIVYTANFSASLYILCGCALAYGLLQFIALRLQKGDKCNNMTFQISAALFNMPRTMKQLSVVQFFSWFALFSMWIYATPAITSRHFGAVDTFSEAYNRGADWVGILFASYNGFAALAAFFIPVMTRFLGVRRAHSIHLILGALGYGSILLISDPTWLLLSMVGVGIAWASILSLPYVMLTNALPSNRLGLYVGVFNFFIVLPQICAASMLGLLINSVFKGDSIYAFLLGALCFILAAVYVLRVDSND